jgi:hypothetical protein
MGAQARRVVTGRQRQLGPAGLTHGVRAEPGWQFANAVDLIEFVRCLGEPSVGDRAHHKRRAEAYLVVGGAEPHHHRQGGPGVLDRGGPVA